MKEGLSRFLKKTAVVLIHLLVSLLVGSFIVGENIWYREDYATIPRALLWIFGGIALLWLEYRVCLRILRNVKVYDPLVLHFCDIIFLIEGLFAWILWLPDLLKPDPLIVITNAGAVLVYGFLIYIRIRLIRAENASPASGPE